MKNSLINDKKQKVKQQKEKDKIIREFEIKWQYLMGQTENFNKFKKSFGLNNITVTDYGIAADIYCPTALYLEKLDTLKQYIETEFSCEFIYDVAYNTNKNKYAKAKFINPEMVKCNQIPFKPFKVKPYEFVAGVDITGNPIVFDVNISPQILIAGQTRRGKNGSCYMGLVSWLHYCDSSEIMFYLFQGAKNDLSQFKDCSQVYCYTNELYKMVLALEHISIEMKRREKLFEPMVQKAEGNDNIFHYNKLHLDKLPYIYVIIDEFIALMIDNNVDSKEIKELKGLFLNYLQGIVQYGGSMGVNVLVLHQKPEKLLMPSFLKNMCNIRICFGFEDETCCQIVLGSQLMKMAHKLPPRKAYYTDNERQGYLYTTDLKGRIKQYIEGSIKSNHRTLFDDLRKLGKLKDEKSNSKNINNSNPSQTGKQEISYELLIKQKERELIEKENKIQKQEEHIKRMALRLKKINEQNFKDEYDKIQKEINKTPNDILEESKSKIENWVDWTPPPETGKEKIE
jgi:S-DNA-T family DNA segregation ATPase FtsK/SpoIIIE